jgi:hypothetical protein
MSPLIPPPFPPHTHTHKLQQKRYTDKSVTVGIILNQGSYTKAETKFKTFSRLFKTNFLEIPDSFVDLLAGFYVFFS